MHVKKSKKKRGEKSTKAAIGGAKATKEPLCSEGDADQATLEKGKRRKVKKRPLDASSPEGEQSAKAAVGDVKASKKSLGSEEGTGQVTPVEVDGQQRRGKKRPLDTSSPEDDADKPREYRGDRWLREVAVEGCHWTTEEEDIKSVFPTAQKVTMVKKKGQFTGTCFVLFETREKAVAEQQRTGITVKGKAVKLSIAGQQAAKSDKQERQVVLTHCPWETAEEDVLEVLPTAEQVHLVRKNGQFTGTCFVTFGTREEAVAASQRTDLQILDEDVEISMSGQPIQKAAKSGKEERQVVLTHCPWETEEEDVLEVLPTAEQVHLVRKNGQFTGTCFVTFGTREEAVAASQRTSLQIKGEAVGVSLPGQPIQKAAKSGKEERQVVLTHCPWETEEEDVLEVLPTAEQVHLVRKNGQFTGTCFVTFGTCEEAVAASQRTSLQIKGEAVGVSLPGQLRRNQKGNWKGQVALTGCPRTMTEDDVWGVFPTAKALNMVLKNEIFTGTCFVSFATVEDANAVAQKGHVTVAGKVVDVSLPGQVVGLHMQKKTQEVVLVGCPPTTKEDDVWGVFPTAEQVRLVRKNGKLTGTCFVTFGAREEALAATQQDQVTIQGTEVHLHLAGETTKDAKRMRLKF